MKRLIRVIILVVGLASIGITSLFIWFQHEVKDTVPLTSPVVVVIEPGMGLTSISKKLVSENVITNPWIFHFAARLTGQSRSLKAGEYRFVPGTNVADILAKLIAHDVIIRFITIPEGLTTDKIIELIMSAEGLIGAPPAYMPEGSLLPETYGYERGQSRAALLSQMTRDRDQLMAELWHTRKNDLPFLNIDEAVVLASIVEKETSIREERQHVASVFINRLKRGMKLQSDPTVIYGLNPSGEGLGRSLRRSELEKATPFNTYLNYGLPPSPICTPGSAALRAVFNPINTLDLYFVADGTGGHVFAETLTEHNRNVAQWRRLKMGLEAN